MSCRKSVTGSLRGLLRRCISSTRTHRAPQSRFIVGNSLFTRCVLPGRALRGRFAAARCLLLIFTSCINVRYSAIRLSCRLILPLLLLLPEWTPRRSVRSPTRAPLHAAPDGPAGLPACHPNNGTRQGLTTRFWIHCRRIANRFAATFTEQLRFFTLSINVLHSRGIVARTCTPKLQCV